MESNFEQSDFLESDLYLGIMSGTSLDGIDVAAVRFSERKPALIPKFDLVGFHSEEWEPELRVRLLQLATTETVSMNELARAHFELAIVYARTVSNALQAIPIDASTVRAIGLHGQTIRHLPSGPTPATFQLGSGAALAALSGIDVVSDFRSADVALGGQGAPLMPMFDRYFLQSDKNRLVVNIGGIANVTWLPANAKEEEVIAFDTGPGNMLLDFVAQKYLHIPFDENGDHARSGTRNEVLLRQWLSEPFFSQAPPKSTGRELFSEGFLRPIITAIEAQSMSIEDALSTLTELTAATIANALQFVKWNKGETELIVSGGGAFNRFLIERIENNISQNKVRVFRSDAFSLPVQAKEAIAFAFFAKAFIEKIAIHLPFTTGAARQTTLGTLSRGH
ncbi:MAG TPA: anhydro-N-acetylmuramic acid kinase [Candidatus Kapabacteria bacterium]